MPVLGLAQHRHLGRERLLQLGVEAVGADLLDGGGGARRRVARAPDDRERAAAELALQEPVADRSLLGVRLHVVSCFSGSQRPEDSIRSGAGPCTPPGYREDGGKGSTLCCTAASCRKHACIPPPPSSSTTLLSIEIPSMRRVVSSEIV